MDEEDLVQRINALGDEKIEVSKFLDSVTNANGETVIKSPEDWKSFRHLYDLSIEMAGLIKLHQEEFGGERSELGKMFETTNRGHIIGVGGIIDKVVESYFRNGGKLTVEFSYNNRQ